MATIRIENVAILTMARGDVPNVIEDGAILIDGDQIAAVGEDDRLSADAERVIDGEGQLALPGLCNGHNHFEQSFMKAIVRVYEGTTSEWIQQFKIPLTDAMTREDYYLSSMLTCIDLLKSGVTCSVNHICQQDPEKLRAYGIAESMRAIEESGVRSVVPVGLAGKNEPDHYIVDADEYASFLEETIEQWHTEAGGRIRVWPGPTGFYSSTGPMWDIATTVAKEHDVGIHTHFATFAEGDVERAKDHGVLGPRFVGAHCVWLSESDVEELAAHDAKVAHNPTYKLGYSIDSEVKEFGDGISPVADMAAHGCTVGLGQDGCMGDTQDLFKEMRMLAFTQQYRYRDKGLFPPSKLLEMATIDCAETMRWDDEIGSIEPGKKADITLLDLSESKFTPLQNIPANVVYQASPENVTTVLVDGEVVMEDRTLKTVDEDAIVDRAQRAATDLFDRADLDDLREKGTVPWESSHVFERK